jgi:hypothetical protein
LCRIEVDREKAAGFWQGEIAEKVVQSLDNWDFRFITMTGRLPSGCFDA